MFTNHASHRARILGLGHAVGIAIARDRVVKAFCLAVAVFNVVFWGGQLLRAVVS